MVYTTIQIEERTRHKLAELKEPLGETYDQIINALMELVPSEDSEGKYTPEFRASLLRGLIDVKHGRTHSLEEVKRRLGIK